MPTIETRPSLLLRLRSTSDDEAWAEFDRRYRDLILRYCRRRGLQTTDAEDLRQVVLLGLTRSIKGFEYRPERGRFHSYLGKIVDNAIRSQRADPRNRVAGLEEAALAAASIDDHRGCDEEWEREWAAHHLRVAMREVRVVCDSKTVDMFDRLLSGVRTDAVAREFGVSIEAVHKARQRVRARLKERVARQIEDEDGV